MNDEQAGERLESWKKIAAYLRRDVRTVQRWEQANGLPIHRHQRAHRPIPYAYTHELDAWWKRQSQSPDSAAQLETPAAPASARRPWLIAIAAILVLAVAGVFGVAALLKTRGAPVPEKSLAVLPFVDLSEDMAHEEFADGLSEELIDRLNRVAGLRVPAPASSFFYKNKQVPVEEVGRALSVAYVLDGSVRKSGERVRIAVRLMRAGDASVVWSESYERPWTDILALQDDVAGEVTKALEAALNR